NAGTELPGRSRPGQEPHDQSQVVSGDVDQVALLNVVPATQPDPAHAAAIEDQREAAFHQLGTEFERLSRDPGAQPRSIVVDRAPRLVVAMPAGKIVAFRLGKGSIRRATVSGFK